MLKLKEKVYYKVENESQRTSLAAKRNYYIPLTYKVRNDNLVSDHKKTNYPAIRRFISF